VTFLRQVRKVRESEAGTEKKVDRSNRGKRLKSDKEEGKRNFSVRGKGEW
jgi:hypothetical protein